MSRLQLEARLTEERAELVASNGLLDQNERLRAAIVAEEREKFQSEKVPLRPISLYSCFQVCVQHRLFPPHYKEPTAPDTKTV